MVLRDGVVKNYLVLDGAIGRMLLSDDQNQRQLAEHIIFGLLADVGLTQVIDECLQGFLLGFKTNGLEAQLVSTISPSWNSYLSTRAVAGMGGDQLKYLQECLSIAVDDLFNSIPEARYQYRSHGNLEDLMEVVLPKISFFLEHVARLLSYSDALKVDIFEDASELKASFEKHELVTWLELFREDLNCLWEKRGVWESIDEFLALNPHVERILWIFHFFPWMTEDGSYRIEIPTAVDMERMLKENPGQIQSN